MTAFQNPPGAPGSAYDRYRYLLRTASPAEIETAYQQAFARMSPLDRRQVRRALVAAHARPANESPAALARAATQLEGLRPGALDRALSASSPGRTVLGSLVSGVVGATVFAFVLYPYLGALGLEGGPDLLAGGYGPDAGPDLGGLDGLGGLGGLGGGGLGGLGGF